MIKVAAILLLAAIACRWAFGRWPWDYLRASPSQTQEVFRARKLLGVSPSATRAQINDAHRRMAARLHPDRGGSDARLAEINTARDLLLAQCAAKETSPQDES